MGQVLREYSEGELKLQTRRIDGITFGHHLERVATTSVSGGGSTYQGTGHVSVSSTTTVTTLCKLWVKSVDGDEVLITSNKDLPFADGQHVQLTITSFGDGNDRKSIGSLANITSRHRIYLIAVNSHGTEYQDHPISEAEVVDWQTKTMKDSVKAVKEVVYQKARSTAPWTSKVATIYMVAALLGGWYFGLWVWLTWIPAFIFAVKYVFTSPAIIAFDKLVDRYFVEAKLHLSLLSENA
jgi:hypothetical protein